MAKLFRAVSQALNIRSNNMCVGWRWVHYIEF